MHFDPTIIRQQLKAVGKTQEDLAHDLGVTVGTVNRWLTGKHKPLRVYQRLMQEKLEGYNAEHYQRASNGCT